MEEQLHPELALQAGIQQDSKTYDIHPSLQAELEPQPEQEVAPIEAAEQPNVAQQTVDTVSTPEDEEPKNRNWRELRAQADRAKQAEREAQSLIRERDFYREQAMAKQKTAEEDDYRTESEKALSREMQELKQKVARQEQDTHEAKRQAAIARAEQRLAQDYPDIREVVTDENIKRLELEYPHLYNSVISSTDVYSVGSTAYEMIIAKGIGQKSTMNRAINGQNSNKNPNASRPRSASIASPQTGETPIQRAGNFMGNSISSEEERKALYAEMINSSRNRAF